MENKIKQRCRIDQNRSNKMIIIKGGQMSGQIGGQIKLLSNMDY